MNTSTPTHAAPDPHSMAYELRWLVDSLMNLSSSAQDNTLSGQDVYALLKPIHRGLDELVTELDQKPMRIVR